MNQIVRFLAAMSARLVLSACTAQSQLLDKHSLSSSTLSPSESLSSCHQ